MSYTHILEPGSKSRRFTLDFLHILVLLLSIFLVVTISIDTFNSFAFYEQPAFMTVQLWICIIFLADYFIELSMSENKWHYAWTHAFFLLVSIPYVTIFNYFGITFSPKVEYFMRFIPLVRGGYAMAIVVGWFTYNKAASLFATYLLTLLATIYFGSLVFFVFERDINPLVNNYSDALWWAFMDVTTVGSNIIAVTAVGRVLSVLLAALGMMMFPIFTVYVTSLIKKRNDEGGVRALKPILKRHDSKDASQADTSSTDTPADTSATTDQSANPS